MKRIYRKCQQKNFIPKHVAEVGVYLPEISNVIDFAKEGTRTTLVEAHPTYVTAIQAYFKDYPKVTLHPIAIYDTPGQLKIVTRGPSTYAEHITGPPSVVNDGYQIDDNDTIIVPSERFDNIDDGTIDLLSIDIEGSEWYVIKHMKSRPVVISVETHGKLYTNPYIREIDHWMNINNYRVWYKDNSDTVYLKLNSLPITTAEKLTLFFKEMHLRFRKNKSKAKQYFRSLLKKIDD